MWTSLEDEWDGHQEQEEKIELRVVKENRTQREQKRQKQTSLLLSTRWGYLIIYFQYGTFFFLMNWLTFHTVYLLISCITENISSWWASNWSLRCLCLVIEWILTHLELNILFSQGVCTSLPIKKSVNAAGLLTEAKVLKVIRGIMESLPELPSHKVLVIALFITLKMEWK